ncbi:TPA: ead/Ea22-like family protein [Salmonella enterica subsp. enterica serovar Orion]|nr:ead/Ea22-like family protein [Salmonella enterica subsp. enterica serovar Orion]HEC9157699.1 ead/Ea22-like family protein [Salmonella enterica subsp. enterica serovar Orion]HEC9175600.1 ead/Ea22-like family protein [Salmonella enterica subsp. enterica serovar Orion]
MSNIDKQALRERYSPKPVPECHICGKEMTIQRMSASRITYGCTGATYDDKGCHYAEGRSIADDHYEQSRVTVVDVSDPDVLALLDENLQLQREKDAIEAVTLALRDDMRQAREQLEAAEKRIAEQREYYEGVIADGSKRIAELEAKLETADRLHDSAFRDGLKAGFSYGQTDDQSGFTQCMSAYNTTPASLLPDGLIRAVHFYEQVKRENPPVETGVWKDAIDWVLKEACLAASTLESSREHEAISQQEKA